MNIQSAHVLPATRLTATGTGAAVDVGDFHGLAQIILNASLMEVAGGLAAVKLTHCETSGGTYVDVPGGAFATITNSALNSQVLEINSDRLMKYVKVVSTLSGTTPAVAIGVTLVGHKQYS